MEKLAHNEALLDCLDAALQAENVDVMRKTVLAKASQVLSLDSASFFLLEHDRFVRPCDLNIDNRLRKDYMQLYYRMSPFRPRSIIKKSHNNVFQIEDLVSRDDFETSEYYNDHFKHLGVHYEIGVYLRSEGEICGFISLNRAHGRTPFGNFELDFAAQLARYIVKPLRLHIVREQECQLLNTLQCANETSERGILVTNRNFEVIYQNARFLDFLQQTNLCTVNNRISPRLYAKILESLGEGDPTGGSGLSDLAVGKQKYTIRAGRFQTDTTADGGPSYIVEITSSCPDRAVDVAALQRRYDLSSREIEVLKLLSQGYCNKEIADKLCISVWTVITHVKNIFAKMGVRNRTEAAQRAFAACAVDS